MMGESIRQIWVNLFDVLFQLLPYVLVHYATTIMTVYVNQGRKAHVAITMFVIAPLVITGPTVVAAARTITTVTTMTANIITDTITMVRLTVIMVFVLASKGEMIFLLPNYIKDCIEMPICYFLLFQ